MYTLQLSGLMLRRLNTGYAQNGTRLVSFFEKCQNYDKLGGYRRKFGLWVREQGVQLAQTCTRQFEFIAAQRIRRSVQIFHLYTRIWDEVALKEFIKSWRSRMLKNTRHFLMSAVGVTMYNWEHQKIGDEELNSYKQEMDGIHRLKESTVVCAKCHLRIIIDSPRPGIKYCTCHDTRPTATTYQDLDGWKPFMEREDMLIWRREEPDTGGLFAYKVYGTFSDVTADDFLQVQIDVDYRKEWDQTARELQIIDTDPKSKTSDNHSNDIIHWEMIWPKLFSNRDYVYQRRWVIDKEKGLIIIISRGTEHPNAPTKPGVYRVTTYWSYMVIRPYTEFHQPGIEFGLTYFDDPGVNVPSAITTWVAISGLPEFLIRMRTASKEYQKYKVMKQHAISPNINYINADEEDISEKEAQSGRGSSEMNERPKETAQVKKHDFNQESNEVESIEEVEGESDIEEENDDIDEEENEDSETNSPTEDERGLLHYFFLTKLFA